MQNNNETKKCGERILTRRLPIYPTSQQLPSSDSKKQPASSCVPIGELVNHWTQHETIFITRKFSYQARDKYNKMILKYNILIIKYQQLHLKKVDKKNGFRGKLNSQQNAENSASEIR